MKKVFIILLFFICFITSYSQSGGNRTHATTLVNSGSNVQLMYKDSYGKVLPLPNGSDGQHLRMVNGEPSWEDYNPRVSSYQNLTGTSITFDVLLGSNLNLTISGNTVVTFSNLTAGDFGVIHVTNPVSLYTLTFQGYDVVIGQAIRKTNRQVFLSALNKYDLFTWDYNGVYVTITGQLDLKLN